jgi:hypothetical protein
VDPPEEIAELRRELQLPNEREAAVRERLVRPVVAMRLLGLRGGSRRQAEA